jgi:hypothetical protein
MREYRLLIAETEPGLFALVAVDERWRVLKNTIRRFDELSSSAHHDMGDIGRIFARRQGFIALAYRDG